MIGFSGCRFFKDRTEGTFQAGRVWIDIKTPDVVILSQNLSQLPKDILSIPVLNEVLTEDLVFYYDNAPSRLSIQGTVNRIAFEHNLSMQEKLVKQVLSEPSEFYAWKGETGRPDYWMAVTKNTYLTKMGEVIGKIALNDSQLIEAGTLKVDGNNIPLYALKYQGHTGLFASHKDKFIFLSDAGMLFEQTEQEAKEPAIKVRAEYKYSEDGKESITPASIPNAQKPKGKLISERVRMVEDLLSVDVKKQENTIKMRLNGLPKEGHHVYLSPSLLTLGYERLMPGFNGIRFDYQQGKWQNQIAVTPSDLPEQKWANINLFQAAPQNAALCGSSPINWEKMDQEVQKINIINNAGIDFKRFGTPVLTCWFEDSPFAAPLFITQLKPNEGNAEKTNQIEQYYNLFGQIIGAKEYTNKERFPLEKKQVTSDIVLMTRIVSARYGSHEVKNLSKEQADKLSANRYFPVTMAVAGSYVFFSPNEDLVNQAIAVYQKKYPALTDKMKSPNNTLLWIRPDALARLINLQSNKLIEPNSDVNNVLKTQIKPKLDLIAKQPEWAVSMDDLPKNSSNGLSWLPLNWQAQSGQ